LGLALYRNALAVPLLLLPMLLGIERLDAFWDACLSAHATVWMLVFCSVFSSAFASLLVFELQRVVTATTTQVANLCCALATLLLSAIIWGGSALRVSFFPKRPKLPLQQTGASAVHATGASVHHASLVEVLELDPGTWEVLGLVLAAASCCLYLLPAVRTGYRSSWDQLTRGTGKAAAIQLEGDGTPKAEVQKIASSGRSTSAVIKMTALIVLTVQNSAAPLLMRQSRSAGGGVAWIAQTGVIMQELLKGGLSVILMLSSGDNPVTVLTNLPELTRSCIPALLYLLQNNLQYVAVTYLDAAMYTVTYQLKILSTAILSVVMLKRRLDGEKWLALMVLVAGVALVQTSTVDPNKGKAKSKGADDGSRQLLGLAAVLSACALSGLAGVYTEKILKGSSMSLWARNAQLALCSMVIGFGGLIFSGDLTRVRSDGFFVGYNVWTVSSVVNNSFGGLLIAVVIKYADNILKNFSTAISIILTTIISATFMGVDVNSIFSIGVLTVCGSTFLYGGACSTLGASICRAVREAVGPKKGGAVAEWGVKATALIVLTFQNSAAPLLMRQSRSSGNVAWVAQTGVIMQELLKGLLSMVLIVGTGGRLSTITESWEELLRSGVPAFLYLAQNNLQYVAVTYLDAATYTVTYQLKILSTAVLSVWMLHRTLGCKKWLSLMVLVLGVSMVQVSTVDFAALKTGKQGADDGPRRQLVGLAAVLSTTVLSGMAGVYTEKILKGSSVSLWTRNAQLALNSLILGSLVLAFSPDMTRIQAEGFFVGYNGWTIASVVNNSFGGLLIAVVIKYADNILKNFSTSISIIITTFISANFMGLKANSMFLAGVGVVCYSTFLYGGLMDLFCVPCMQGDNPLKRWLG